MKTYTAMLPLEQSYWALSAGCCIKGGGRVRYGSFGGCKQRAALQASLTEGMTQVPTRYLQAHK